MIGRLMRYGLLLVPLLFLAVFFFYPLGSILAVSLFPNGQPDFSGFATVATSAYFRETLWFTVWQAAVSTVLTVGLALPGAYVFTHYKFWGKGVLLSVSTLPFVLPTVVVAAAFTALLGGDGVINRLLIALFTLETAPVRLERSLALIFVAHVFYNYAIALRIIAGYWANQPAHIPQAARVLGADTWRLWRDVYLPTLRPAITAAALLVYIFTFTSFGVILILGGLRYATLEVEIYRQVTSLFDLPTAAALSLVQIGVMGLMMVLYTRLQRRGSGAQLQASGTVAHVPYGWRDWLLVVSNLLVMAVLILAPLAALVVQSVSVGGGLSGRYYVLLAQTSQRSVLFVPPLVAVRYSLIFAALTTILGVGLGVIASYLLAAPRGWLTRILDPVFMLPLATSAVTLGFGFIIALDEPPLNLRTSRWLIPLAHTLVALPFVVRSVLPALRAIPANLREAAATLGANDWRVLRLIDLPLISRGVVVGATFAFTVSMGEFGATLFIARPDTPTMPVVIYRLLGQPGLANYGQAMAMSVILIGVCGVAFVMIERLRTAGIGEF